MKSRLGTIILFMIIVMLFILSAPLWASGDCKGRSCNQGSDVDINVSGGSGGNVGDVSGGSVGDINNALNSTLNGGANTASNNATIEGSRSYGYGMGDVDINDCYRSWSVPLVQGSQVNPLCLAQQLIIEGHYEAAATLRCQPRGVYKAFGGRDECIEALSAPPPSTLVAVPEITRTDDEDYHAEHEAELEALRAAVAEAKEKARKATLEARYVAQQVEKAPEGLSDEQYAELEAWQGRWEK